MNAYQLKAQATKARRTYQRPTLEQHKAYSRLLQRDGEKNLTVEDAALLATHPYLSPSQKLRFSQMVEAQNG